MIKEIRKLQKNTKENNNMLLTEIVKKEKKVNKEFSKILTKVNEPIWMPSFRSFFIILLWLLPFVFIAHLNYIYNIFI